MQFLIAHLSDRVEAVAPRIMRLGYMVWNPYPSYIFFNYTHRWPEIGTVDGVSKILGNGEGDDFSVCMLANEVVEMIMDYRPTLRAGAHPFTAEEPVRIISGAETGLVGKYHGKDSDGERSVIELDFLGGKRKITIRTDRLASASALRPLPG